jgi:HEAT repeat protein
LRAVEKENPDAVTADHWSVKCLTSLGSPAVPALAKSLSSPAKSVRLVAVRTLGGIGEDAAGAEQALLEVLADDDARVRALALSALASAKTASKILAPRVATALKDPSPAVRRAALQIVPTLEDARAPLMPAIVGTLKDSDVDVRIAAVTAFTSAEGDPAKRLPVLAAMLDDEDAGARRAAVASLAALGEKGADAAPRFIPLLRNDSERGFALEALKKFKMRAVPPLIDMLQVNDAAVRVFACERLASMGPDAREAIPPLQGLLQDAHENVRAEAQKAIEKIEPPK